MPIAIVLAVFISVGTSFAAQGAVPGDFLYPIKTEVNENVRSAFAFGTNAEARLQADLLEERLEEAKKLYADETLSTETELIITDAIKAQAKHTAEAVAKSDTEVANDLNARMQLALESFVGTIGLESSLASNINASLNTSVLSEGTVDVDAYLADMKFRITALRAVMKQHQADIKADVEAELNAKLDTAGLLVLEASGKTEAEARASLNGAAVLIQEVEAKLSTLGQARVDTETGVITDIDFSVDPMKIDATVEGGGSAAVQGIRKDPDTPQSTEPNSAADINLDISADAGLHTNIVR